MRHGGSLWVAVPRDFAIRMGVGHGDAAWVSQPFTDVILILRGDSPLAEVGGAEVRGILACVLDQGTERLRATVGGFPTAGEVGCSICQARGATFTFTTVNVCPPCERELAACWAHRLDPSPAESCVDGG